MAGENKSAGVPNVVQGQNVPAAGELNGGKVPQSDLIKDEWPRFFAHWAAATLGFFLRSLLPVLQAWSNPATAIAYPRWWVALLFASLICLVGAGINSNLPAKPRELLKSIGLGFALDAAAVLAKIAPAGVALQ
jgi:hypothetical protein